jgi:DNA-binding beta-propeller fold protein YncE
LFSITGGTGTDVLKQPIGVAVHPITGNIYVTDTGNGRVQVFDPNGNSLFKFKTVARDGMVGSLVRPTYIAINKRGEVYVADRAHRGLFVFTTEGKFIKELKPKGYPQFKAVGWMPVALEFDDKDFLYLTDIRINHRVLKIDTRTGKVLKIFGKLGRVEKVSEKPGVLLWPNGLAYDGKRKRIYVADSDNRRVQVFDLKGKPRKIIGTGGLPRGIDIDYKGRLLVVDTFAHNVLVYGPKGDFLTSFGERGFDYGQFQYPNGLTTGPMRRIYVTDRENNRVQVWQWPPELPPPIRKPLAKVCPWWWLLLLLIPLWLYLRRRKFLAVEEFIERIISERKLRVVRDGVKALYEPEELCTKYEDYEEDGVKMAEVLRPKEYYEDLIDRIEQDYGVSRTDATVLSAAIKGIGKRTILADDEKVRAAAKDLDMKAMTFEEFLERYEITTAS